MNKNQKRAIVVAAILSSQLAAREGFAQNSSSQKTVASADPFLKVNSEKLVQKKTTLVACLNGNPVYKSGKGELFTVNAGTGDLNTIGIDVYMEMKPFEKQEKIVLASKQNSNRSARKPITFKYATGLDGIKIIGVDKDGHVVHQNNNGEKFIIDPSTGDMVDYIGHVTLLR